MAKNAWKNPWAFLKDKLLILHICKFSLFYSEVAYGKNEYMKTSFLQ